MSKDAPSVQLHAEIARAREGVETTIEHLMHPVTAAELKDFVAMRYKLTPGAVGMAFSRLWSEEAFQICPDTDWVMPLP